MAGYIHYFKKHYDNYGIMMKSTGGPNRTATANAVKMEMMNRVASLRVSKSFLTEYKKTLKQLYDTQTDEGIVRRADAEGQEILKKVLDEDFNMVSSKVFDFANMNTDFSTASTGYINKLGEKKGQKYYTYVETLER